jgi:UDP-3-O-[3-hydroxymyristoyl] glucosamine N-acyltransferase
MGADMRYTIAEIAAAIGAEAEGDLALTVTGAAEPGMAGPEDLALALSPDYADALAAGRARAAMLWAGADWQAMGLLAAIRVPRGRLAMARLTTHLDLGEAWEPGVHPTAVIGAGARLGDGVTVGPFAVIDAGAEVGAGGRIGAHVSIAGGTVLGAGVTLLPGVRIGRRVRIGAGCLIHPNAVIGADGFSFVTERPSHVETARKTMSDGEVPGEEVDPTWHRIHSLGGVEIGADVEIGAGTTVDAGTIRATQVGPGCKIDNLCQIAHNVVLGAHCLIAGQAGIAGSTRVGDRTVIGGKAGIADNLVIGADVVIGGACNIMANVPAGRVMMAMPAMQIAQQVESYKALRRLPRLMRDIAARAIPVSKPDASD